MDNSGFGQAPRPIDKQASSETVISPPSGSQDPKTTIAKLTLTAQMKGGASWFYWIAGLSLINTIASLSGTHWRFILGLGLTQIVDGVALRLGGAGANIAAVVVDVFITGLFLLFGVFAARGQKWAFLIGMILFGLDTGLEFLLKDWLSLAFHGYILYRIYGGFSKIQLLNDMNEFTQVGY